MRVLLATDGSEAARAAAEWLTIFPLPPATDVQVLAVTVLPPQLVEIPTRRDLDAQLMEEARRAVHDARRIVQPRWAATTTSVVDGDPRETIPGIADEWSAELIVVGARGLSAVRRFVLGSVSTAVVHAAHCPVLVVKEHARELRKVVVAVDGSADSLAAARFFASLPLAPNLVVRLVGVIERPYAPRSAPGVVAPAIRAAIDQIIAERRVQLEPSLTSLETVFREKVGAIERALPIGRPADEILAEAEDPEVDLIVVGARGLGPVKRLVLGSVSERVLHEARCPVLVVKGH